MQNENFGAKSRRALKITGVVSHIDSAMQNGAISVDIRADVGQAVRTHSGVTADGTIETWRVPNATHLTQQLQPHADATLPIFKISGDGTEARRVIVSDTSTWNRYDQVRLQ